MFRPLFASQLTYQSHYETALKRDRRIRIATRHGHTITSTYNENHYTYGARIGSA